MSETLFRTMVINLTDHNISLKNPPHLGSGFTNIQPGAKQTIQFHESEYFLMPYSEIIYKKNSQVVLRDRPGWKPPQLDGWITIFLNEGGAMTESFHIDHGHFLYLPKGIPVVRFLRHDSFFVDYESVTIGDPIEVAVPCMMRPGMMEIQSSPNIIRVKRSKKDLDMIQKEREAAHLLNLGLQGLVKG